MTPLTWRILMTLTGMLSMLLKHSTPQQAKQYISQHTMLLLLLAVVGMLLLRRLRVVLAVVSPQHWLTYATSSSRCLHGFSPASVSSRNSSSLDDGGAGSSARLGQEEPYSTPLEEVHGLVLLVLQSLLLQPAAAAEPGWQGRLLDGNADMQGLVVTLEAGEAVVCALRKGCKGWQPGSKGHLISMVI